MSKFNRFFDIFGVIYRFDRYMFKIGIYMTQKKLLDNSAITPNLDQKIPRLHKAWQQEQ
jgi:hypothetical protein